MSNDTSAITAEPGPEDADEILGFLCSRLKVDRDKGIFNLESLVKKWEDTKYQVHSDSEKKKIQESILENLGYAHDSLNAEVRVEGLETESIRPWEMKHGCLMACYPLIASSDQYFLERVQTIALKLLRDDEIRVQLAAGGVLGFLSKYLGPPVYEASRETLMELILKNLQTNARDPEDELMSPEQGFDLNVPAYLIKEKVTLEAIEWKKLEPALKCLQFMIENLSSDFILSVDQRLINTIMSCLDHPNRYIRETGFQICTALIISAPENVMEFGHQLSEKLSLGLSDPWNQVRLAALTTTRRFLITFKNTREQFFPCLLPRLCLNRYYKAEGVRVYCQESWKLIVGTEGRLLVARYISDIVKVYIETCKSSNPAERDAACSCISELAQKIEVTVTQPFVDRLLQTLISCSVDVAWSVRDAACLAFGNFITHYPEESKPHINEMFAILLKNLEDPVVLLRQGAGTVLATIVNAYGHEFLLRILNTLSIGLRSVDKMKRLQNLGEELTRDQHCPYCQMTLISPENLDRLLATKLPSGASANTSPAAAIGPVCSRHKLSQPWHLTDGCLYLIGALAELSICQNELSALVPLMISTTKFREYGEHFVVLETLCKIIPLVARGIGKKQFKDFLELVFEPIFYAAESQSPATAALGKHCVTFLSEFIGPNILKSRIELYNPRYLHFLDKPELPFDFRKSK